MKLDTDQSDYYIIKNIKLIPSRSFIFQFVPFKWPDIIIGGHPELQTLSYKGVCLASLVTLVSSPGHGPSVRVLPNDSHGQ